MTDHDNPYRAPSVPVKGKLPEAGVGGIWRDGNYLVVRREARLPPICVKSNTSADRVIERRFYWHRPLIYLLLIQFMIYVIVALAIRKRHDLAIPISSETARKRSKTLIITSSISVLGLVVLVGTSIVLLDSNLSTPAFMFGVALAGVGLLVGLIASIYGTSASTILRPIKMTKHATWFKGASQEYLAALPVLPPEQGEIPW